MPTIFDVAEKAGVSITTVSRALNGHSDVSADTRRRVFAAATALHYYPSAAARSLRHRRSNTIVFAPEIRSHAESQPFHKEFIGALALACLKHDLSLLATVAESPHETAALYRELAGSRRADGIILADIRPDDARIALLREIGIPFVAFGRTRDYGDLAYPFVDVDGAAGMQAMVAHLQGRGHRRIAYLSESFATSYAVHRYAGYREALGAAGLPVDEDLILGDLRDGHDVARAVDRLFNRPPAAQPTALMCSSDWLALDVLGSLRARGYVVGGRPGQIAVSGFDDLSFAAYLHPPLTTLRQPLDLACATLLDVLSALMRSDPAPVPAVRQPGVVALGPRQLLLAPTLVVRDSA